MARSRSSCRPPSRPSTSNGCAELIRAHFYDGQSFYRVIDGFVAQGGIGEDTASTKDDPKRKDLTERSGRKLKAEFDRAPGRT